MEIWYALQDIATKQYFQFRGSRGEIETVSAFYEDVSIVELLISPTKIALPDYTPASEPEYVAGYTNGNIVLILPLEEGKERYEEEVLYPVLVSEITRCARCNIACIDGVFHWSYKMTPTTEKEVLARVCLPTEGKGDNKDAVCLAKLLHSEELGLSQKSIVEKEEFINQYNSRVEFGIQVEDYLKLASEILNEQDV